MGRISSMIIGAVAFACGASLNATKGPSQHSVDQARIPRGIIDDRTLVDAASSLLRVENVRLEAAVHAETTPSTLLKFDVINGTSTPLTTIVLEISILEKPAPTELTGRVLVRPFEIRGNVALEAGYTLNFEMLLRNLSSDCRCIANVEVVSVH